MREHPLVPQIRFWLLMAALAAIAITWPPEASGVFLATGFGWWPGCGCCNPLCGDCAYCDTNTTYCRYQVVITGVANMDCSHCSVYNATFTLSQDVSTSTCFFKSPSVGTLCTGVDYVYMQPYYNSGTGHYWTAVWLGSQDGVCSTIGDFLKDRGISGNDCSSTINFSHVGAADICQAAVNSQCKVYDISTGAGADCTLTKVT